MNVSWMLLWLALQPAVLSEMELATAQRGQVPVRTEVTPSPTGKAAGRGVGAIVINRPAAAVFAVVARFEDKAEYMPRLKAIRVLQRDADRVQVHMTVDASVATARYTLWFRVDQPAGIVSWALDRGAPGNTIADAEGAYQIRALGPSQTLLIYQSAVDTGRSVPRFIQDYMTRRSIPNLLRAIKARIENRTPAA